MIRPEADSAHPQGEGPSSEQRRRKRQKIIFLVFLAFFIILWILVRLINEGLERDGRAESGQSKFVVVEIEPGSGVSGIARNLREKGVISSEFLFKFAAVAKRSTRRLKAGEYRFERSMSMLEVLSWLEHGHVMLHQFTVPEGATVAQIAKLLERNGLADAKEFTDLANNPEFCKELGVGGPNLEGFLFPETYKIAKGLPVKQIIFIMLDRFWWAWSAANHDPSNNDTTEMRNIITIASIIEKEAVYNHEKPLIASVIYNRLSRNMRLQCDVTIRYPLDNYGIHLTYSDLKLKSPYNSYLYRGLPPTPICNPGFMAIKAAIDPPDTDYLYFVSMNNGRHKFSTNLNEHNKAVLKYQILNERG